MQSFLSFPYKSFLSLQGIFILRTSFGGKWGDFGVKRAKVFLGKRGKINFFMSFVYKDIG
jgi:hypothetical protein